MENIGIFPFGKVVKKVVQTDRSAKEFFVLGVYASAVHARWVDFQGKTLVKALAIASEPYIFWRGEGAQKIINTVKIPAQLGKLIPATKQFNGPSGKALDELVLEPLGLARKNVWLCDLIPHSCMNTTQSRALERTYFPVAKKYDLPLPTVPRLPRTLTDSKRRKEILEEIKESKAEKIILLGDKPIQWFLNFFDDRWKRLADFQPYGKEHAVELAGKKYLVLPIAHPRQIAHLGYSSKRWFEIHQRWLKNINN